MSQALKAVRPKQRYANRLTDSSADPLKRSMPTEQKSFAITGFALIIRRTRKRNVLGKTEWVLP